MAFREVRVFEVREVLRLWLRGEGLRGVERLTQVDRKTVRRYVDAAVTLGLVGDGGEDQLTDVFVGQVVEAVHPHRCDGHGEAWRVLVGRHDQLEQWLKVQNLTVVKTHELLGRRGVVVPQRTLHRYALEVLDVSRGRRGSTVRVADGEPGEELQVDFGKLGRLFDPDTNRNRDCWALIFTPVVSRYTFVWLTFRQTIDDVIAGFEAVWTFYGGVFATVIPDNLKAMVDRDDPLEPRLNQAFVEYAQARGFAVDPARVRAPQDKPRVERTVPFVRQSFFAGEDFVDLADGQRRAEHWCRVRAGLRAHGTIEARPAEVFPAEEAPVLRPAPTSPYDLPRYSTSKVHRDHHIEVAKALSLSARIGQGCDLEPCVRLEHPSQGVGGEELSVGDRGDAGGDVHRGADVVALPVQQRAEVGADADRWEVLLAVDRGVDVEPASHGVGGIGECEHELVADLFDDLAAVPCYCVAHEFGEAADDAGGGVVAHRFGQRREPGQVDEHDRRLQFARGLSRRGGRFGEMENEVLAQRPLDRLAMEVEQRGFGEVAYRIADAPHGRSQFGAGESSRAQPLVNVVVEELGLGFGHPADGVGVDADQLQQRLFRDAGGKRHRERTLRLHVFVERLVLVAQTTRHPQAAHRVKRKAMRGAHRSAGDQHHELADHVTLTARRLGKILGAQPAALRVLDQSDPLNRVGREPLTGPGQQAESAPAAHLVTGGAGDSHHIDDAELSRLGTQSAWPRPPPKGNGPASQDTDAMGACDATSPGCPERHGPVSPNARDRTSGPRCHGTPELGAHTCRDGRLEPVTHPEMFRRAFPDDGPRARCRSIRHSRRGGNGRRG